MANQEPSRSLLWPAVLYDGTIQHKLLGLHQVRAGAPNNLPYDLVFIGVAAVMLLVGLLLLRVAASPSGGRGWWWPRAAPMLWRNWYCHARQPVARPWPCPPI